MTTTSTKREHLRADFQHPAKEPHAPAELPAGLPAVEVELPKPPAHLTEIGRAAWTIILRSLTWRREPVDLLAVARAAELLEERALVRVELLARGPLLTEKVTNYGKVICERIVPNPVIDMLARIDKSLDSISAQLGLTPAARARLGLEATQAELKAAEVQRVLSGKYRKEEAS